LILLSPVFISILGFWAAQYAAGGGG